MWLKFNPFEAMDASGEGHDYSIGIMSLKNWSNIKIAFYFPGLISFGVLCFLKKLKIRIIFEGNLWIMTKELNLVLV